MKKYGKFMLGFWRHVFFALAVILAVGYIFVKSAPKASQMAKEEVLEHWGLVNKDTIKKDTIITNKFGGYVNREVDVEGALRSIFNNTKIEIIYVGIPEIKIPTIADGKLVRINLNDNLRAKSVKFKMENGKSYNVFIIFDRLTGKVVDVINDERYIVTTETPVSQTDTVPAKKDSEGNPDYTNNGDI